MNNNTERGPSVFLNLTS